MMATRGAMQRGRGNFWWRGKAPAKNWLCYATRGDALRKFITDKHNAAVLAEWGGFNPSPYARRMARENCEGKFDPINVGLGLEGKRRACLLDDAVHAALPRGKGGYCLDRINLDLLNAVGALIGSQAQLRLPPWAIERRAEKDWDAGWKQQQAEKEQDWDRPWQAQPSEEVPF